jgi:hypothetical protein
MEGSGKTHFALSAPRPLTYLDFDFGVEGVAGGTGITHKTYDMLAATWMPEAQAKKHALDVMRGFVADFRAAIAAKERTLVVDTFTAAWAGQRLARADDKYIEMEAEFKSLVQAAYASPCTNLILIHHLRQDWKRDSAGKSYKGTTWSRDGMDGIANMVQLAIRQRYVAPVKVGMLETPGRFEFDVLKSRDNIGLVGQTYPAMDFATLCGMVCPSVDWSK